MTGAPLWDAAIWAVLGLIAGAVLARWAGLRAPLFFALVVAVLGFLMVPMMFVIFGADGSGYAILVVLWSVPTTVGLALGAALSRIRR